MKRYFDHPIVSLKPEVYITLLVFLLPVLNFLSGLTIDMYAPSLPAIARQYMVSTALVKNTISITILGTAVGCILCGVLMDRFGRKRILMIGLFLYAAASFLAIWNFNISELLILRFMQGLTIAAVSIGCRAIVSDTMTGHQFAIAILYTTIAYGLGPIIGPFVGGYLQYHFDWQASFIIFGIFSIALFFLIVIFLQESIPEKQPIQFRPVTKKYFTVLSHPVFLAGVFIASLGQVELMIYPTLGPFIVENALHQNAIVYGNTALVVGGSYFFGAIINRLMMKRVRLRFISMVGFVILIFSLLLSYLFSVVFSLNLMTVMVPLILIGISGGLISPNILVTNLRLFSKNVAIAMAAQSSVLTLIAAVGVFGISHFHVDSLFVLAYIYTVLIVLQSVIFFGYLYPRMS